MAGAFVAVPSTTCSQMLMLLAKVIISGSWFKGAFRAFPAYILALSITVVSIAIYTSLNDGFAVLVAQVSHWNVAVHAQKVNF